MRNRGYERAVAELGLECIGPVQVEGIAERDRSSEANFRLRARCFAGYLVEHLRSGKPVDAVMAATDYEAFAVLAACRLFGRDDIAVTGYDNRWQHVPERAWEPGQPFATVEKDNHQLGEQMVELLRQRIEKALPPGPQQRLVDQQVVRG